MTMLCEKKIFANWSEVKEAIGAGIGKVVLTNGCFDIFHADHVHLFDFCGRLGELVVAVDSDENVRKLKGQDRPFFSLKDRILVIATNESVSAVFPFDGPVADVVKEVRPDFLVKGADWAAKKIEGEEFAGRTLCAPLWGKERLGTRTVIERIRSVHPD